MEERDEVEPTWFPLEARYPEAARQCSTAQKLVVFFGSWDQLPGFREAKPNKAGSKEEFLRLTF